MVARRALIIDQGRIAELPQGADLATRKALVFLDNGQVGELPVGDTLVGGSSGGGGGPGITDGFSLKLNIAEAASPAPTDAATFALAALYTETNALQTEAAQLKFPAGVFGESSPAPTDARTVTIRCWATGCTTNETAVGNTIAPGNANGSNDGVFAMVKTGTGAPPGTTNPVRLTTGSMNAVGGFTITSATLRIWFKLGAITLSTLDDIDITYNTGGGPSGTFWQGPALATLLYPGEDYSTTALSKTLDFSALTFTQLQALQVVAKYNAGVVLTAQATLQIDAIALDITGTI